MVLEVKYPEGLRWIKFDFEFNILAVSKVSIEKFR